MDIFDEHVKQCSSRTEKCPLCGKYIKLIDYDVHVSTLACKNEPVPEVEPPRPKIDTSYRPGRGQRRVTAVAPRANRIADRLKKGQEDLNNVAGDRQPASVRRSAAPRRPTPASMARTSRRPAQPEVAPVAPPQNISPMDNDELMARQL